MFISSQLSVQDIEGHVMGIVEILLFNLPENSVHVNRIRLIPANIARNQPRAPERKTPKAQ